ncbi:MAG: alpha/beta hydrolase [Bacillota bacterium]|nr:alpha/beta hydrolase [Bacillota bacterium]
MKLFNFENNEDPILKIVKAVHSAAEGTPSMEPEGLKKQRDAQDLLGKMITQPIGTTQTNFMIKKIPCAWAKPDYVHLQKKVILYCHGGGYTCGSLTYAGIMAHKLAMYCGLDVLFFEYRLAPENPYPKGLKDAISVWNYLMHIGYGAENVILIGDSAGGNMALELCLHLKNNQRLLPSALVLLSPWTDMTMTSPTYETKQDVDPLLTVDYIRVVREAYAGHVKDYANPKLSPLFADLHDFPKTYIQVGESEILLNDSTALAKKLLESGVACKLDIFENGWHVFQQLPMPRSNAAMKEIGTWVQNNL